MSALDVLLTAATSRAELAARERGLRVVVKTSITPAVTVYDARDTAPGLLEALGIKTHIVAVTADGVVVSELGEPAPTELGKAAVYFGTLAILGFLLVVLASRALR